MTGGSVVPDAGAEGPNGVHDGRLVGLDVALSTARFSIRTLRPSDVGASYAEWFDDSVVQEFIAWRPANDAIKELRDFVAGHVERGDSLLLGVFAGDGRHVANLKYEPIDLMRRTAVLGVLVGDVEWRGRGLFGEVFAATAEMLRDRFGITTVRLGVDGENAAALAAYVRAGFVAVPRVDTGPLWMECRLV
jgi:ribosomal-protein-alanine N-acetyltransferase